VATRRDLLEAAAHDRRRVGAAFGPRGPGGAPVEPSRPGRAVLTGLAVAVLVVAGAAVAGVLGPAEDIDWAVPMLVNEEGAGATYVNVAPTDGGAPELHRVTDVTSARLLVGADAPTVVATPEQIAERSPGPTLGILGAPQAPPAAADLDRSTWTGCVGGVTATGDRSGTRLQITRSPQVGAAGGRAVLVRALDRYWLVAESDTAAPGTGDGGGLPRATAYEVRDVPGVDSLLDAVAGLSLADAVPVTDTWLALLPRGAALDLDGYDLDGLGGLVADPAATGLPGSPRVGDVVETTAGDVLVLTVDGLMRLDPFAAAVYPTLPRGDAAAPRTYRVEQPPPALPQRDTTGYAATGWPREVVAPDDRTPVDQPCVVLTPTSEGTPGLRLAAAGDGAPGATDVPAGETRAGADPGIGALVVPTPAGPDDGGAEGEDGAPVATLVDDLGRAYPVADDSALADLGYAEVDPVAVPEAWLAALTVGPTLSVEAARCPPTAGDCG